MEKQRIVYFDFLKVISIFLVIFVHYSWISDSKASNLTMIMTIIAVPLFFMINGALLLSKEKFDIKSHYKKLFWIIIGTISWKFLILLICLITSRVNMESFSATDIFNYGFTATSLHNVPAEHLWFMYALIRIYIIYPFIRLAFEKDKKYIKYMFVFGFIFSFGIELFNTIFFFVSQKGIVNKFSGISNTFCPVTDLTYITYFLLGYLVHNKFYVQGGKWNSSKVALLLGIYIIGILMILLARYMQVGSLLDGKYQRINEDYTKMGNLIMTSSLFILFSGLPIKENKFVSFIGKRTINIYYIHMILVAYANTYLLPFLKQWKGVGLNFIRTVIIFIISVGITELIKIIKPAKKIFNLS